MLPATKEISIPEAIASGVTGTTFMTLFSYLVSEAKERNFREPELLATLLRRIVHRMNKRNSRLAGWALHFAVGIVFSMFYVWLWNEKKIKASGASGMALGAVSGVIGALTWYMTFKLHPLPPKTSYKKYYGHLLITHVVFGLFAFIGYKIARKLFHRQKPIIETPIRNTVNPYPPDSLIEI